MCLKDEDKQVFCAINVAGLLKKQVFQSKTKIDTCK